MAFESEFTEMLNAEAAMLSANVLQSENAASFMRLKVRRRITVYDVIKIINKRLCRIFSFRVCNEVSRCVNDKE